MRGLVCAAVVALWAVAEARGQTTFHVAAGFDLLETTTGSTFTFPVAGPTPLVGVPLGTFDFDNLLGRGIGVQNTGSADTIIERTTAAIPTPPPAAGSSATIPITMLALQMETAVPINIGAGLHNYFITLQSTHGGTPTVGTMTITWDATGLGGTFTSFFDVFFDIRQDSLAGPIVSSSDLTLTNTGAGWTDLPPPGAEQIRNVNRFLSGTNGDPTQDFWPIPPFTESHPGVGVHQVRDAVVPEPASVALLGLGSCVALVARGHLRRRAA
jgi:hypothetical protein